jgi:hypothetical protein
MVNFTGAVTSTVGAVSSTVDQAADRAVSMLLDGNLPTPDRILAAAFNAANVLPKTPGGGHSRA